MNQQKVLKTAGLLSVGVVSSQAQGVIIELPQLNQTLEVTGDGTLGAPVRNAIAVDLLPSNPFKEDDQFDRDDHALGSTHRGAADDIEDEERDDDADREDRLGPRRGCIGQ